MRLPQLLASAVTIAALSTSAAAQAPVRQPSRASYWRRFAAGFASSILAHEAGHVGTALALGAHPSFGFNKARPTIYSGIDATTQPHQQFLFSSAGLTVQSVLDEAILDVPHDRGAHSSVESSPAGSRRRSSTSPSAAPAR